MLGFFIAFAVKLPAVPFHTWLADAHTEAPTAGSVILAGLLLKTGGYGLIRFILPLFPEASKLWAPVAMTAGVIGILYGATMAFAQTDLKRLVAYTSISHLGFVLLGVFSGNDLALLGAVMQMIAHGIGTGALFILVGMLQERLGTRDMSKMGGLWTTAPRMSGVTLIFVLASLGLPGLGSFIGEFLVLVRDLSGKCLDGCPRGNRSGFIDCLFVADYGKGFLWRVKIGASDPGPLDAGSRPDGANGSSDGLAGHVSADSAERRRAYRKGHTEQNDSGDGHYGWASNRCLNARFAGNREAGSEQRTDSTRRG